MATIFKIEVDVPRTATHGPRTLSWTQVDQIVQHVEIEYRKEKARSSFLTAGLKDWDGKIASYFPDPAFADIPVRFSFARADKQQPEEVFTGKLTRISGSWPMGGLELVAHDKAFDLKQRAKQRTFKNLTAKQAVEKIAAEYGIQVDWDHGDANLVQRVFDIGIGGFAMTALSDWDHINRILEADGLHAFVRKGKLYVRQQAKAVYPVTFRPGDGRVVSVEWSINHVRGPGGGGNKTTTTVLEHAGSVKAVKGDAAKEAAAVKGGDARTHRRPIGGAAKDTNDAHSMDIDGAKWENHVTPKRGRKDECSMTLNPEPALNLTHLVKIEGFNAKIDGTWETVSMKHVLVPNDGGSTTVVQLGRGTGSDAAKKAGGGLVPFQFKGSST